MTMVGMDIAAVRALAGAFDAEADQLDAVRGAIDSALGSTGWEGPDAVEFQTLWSSSYQRILVNCAKEIREAGKTARRNADEQEQASQEPQEQASQKPGGLKFSWEKKHLRRVIEDDGLPGPFDDWLIEAVDDGADWVADRIQGGIGKVFGEDLANRFADLWEAYKTHNEAARSVGSQVSRIFTEGRIPQPAEMLSSGILLFGTGFGLLDTAVTGKNHHIFDDGDPWTGTPSTDLKGGTSIVPKTLQDVMGIGHDTYESDGVRVVGVTGDDGKTRFIVAVPGTEPGFFDPAGWTGNPNGRDWPANVWGIANGRNSGSEATSTAVDKAIEQYQADHPGTVIGDRPELLMTGHSQGGITMVNVASDSDFASRYNIKGIITNGSPVDCAEIPSDVPVLALQHGEEGALPGLGKRMGDIIPRLDLGGWPGSPDNVTHGYLPAQAEVGDMESNHLQKNYADSVAPGTPGGQIMSDWQAKHPDVGKFLTKNKDNSVHYDVPFGRTTE